MIVSTSAVRSDAYAGNGVTTAFPVGFQFMSAADLRVVAVHLSSGAETTKTLDVDYTVSGGAGGTGTVTALSAPPSGVAWVILRATTALQETQFRDGDRFNGAGFEAVCDRLTMLAQEASARGARALRLPDGDGDGISVVLPAAAARAGRAVVFAFDGGVGVGQDLYDDQADAAAGSAALSQAWAVGGAGVPAGQSAAERAAAADQSADLAQAWAVGGAGVPAGQSAAARAQAADEAATLAEAWAIGGGGVPVGQSAAERAAAADAAAEDAAAALAAMQPGVAGGVATLGPDGKVPAGQMGAHGHVISDVTGLQAALDAYSSQMDIYNGGALVGSRRGVNFVAGNNVALAMVDNAGAARVDVTVAVDLSGWGWDAAYKDSDFTLSGSGGTVATLAAGSAFGSLLGDKAISGKRVFSVILTQHPGLGAPYIGVCVRGATLTNTVFAVNPNGYGYGANGNRGNNNSYAAYGASYTTTDRVDVWIDTSAGKIWFAKNGVFQGGGDPIAGTSPAYTFLVGSVVLYPAAHGDGSSAGCVLTVTSPPTASGWAAL